MLRQTTSRNIKPRRRHVLCALALLPAFAAVHFLSYWLRFDAQFEDYVWTSFFVTVVWAAAIKLVVFGWFRVYQGWTRYVTFHDLVALIKAATVSSLLLLLADYLFHPSVTTARSVFLMDWGFTIVLVGGVRSMARFLEETRDSVLRSVGKTSVFIVGANDSGEALLRAIRRNPRLACTAVGFITDDRQSLQTHIGGVRVVGMLEDTCQLALEYDVSEVLITAGELSGQQVRQLVEEGRAAGVTVKVLPSYEQLLRGTVDLKPREVSIEDLLRRDPVRLDMQELERWIDDHVLLVTGSAGSIGSEICRQLLQFSPERLVLVDRSENGQFFLERELRRLAPTAQIDVCMADITDAQRMSQIFRDYRPGIVFHAAAYKHVPLMETNPGEAVKNITLASRQLADLAHQHGVSSFVMISTDKAVNPTSVMGVCKRIAELYVQALAESSDCRFVTVRFGNVLDSDGSVVPIFREQIATGGPVTVTHPEMNRFFMTIPEASQLVIQAGAMGRGGEIFVLDMGEPVRIVDLAADMIRLSGLEVGKDISIEFVGQRPGEKLFEELHCDGERHLATSHPKITVAQCDRTEMSKISAILDRLANVTNGPSDLILPQLSRAVPQFRQSSPSAVPPMRRAA